MPVVTINRNELLNLVKGVKSVAPTNSPKEILKFVRITCSPRDNSIVVAASNGEIHASVRGELVAGAIQGGDVLDVLVDPKIIMGLLGSARADEAELSLLGDKLVLRCDGEAKVPTADPQDFPAAPTKPDGFAWVVDSSEFCTAIGGVSVACEMLSTKYALGGVLIGCVNGEVPEAGSEESTQMAMVATDSKRMIFTKFKCRDAGQSLPPKLGVVVPQNAIKSLRSICHGDMQICITENTVWFTGHNWSLSTMLVAGRFPNYRKVIPTECEKSVLFDVETVRNVVDRASVFNEAESRGLNLSVSDVEIDVSADRQIGAFSGSVVVETVKSGEDYTVTLCSVLFGSLLSPSILGEKAEMRLVDGDSAVVFVSGSTQVVLMPLASR